MKKSIKRSKGTVQAELFDGNPDFNELWNAIKIRSKKTSSNRVKSISVKSA
ncbi:MAG: hypothetical protein K0S33_3413 [Bacteroidetes bacterium]|jgi:hypothetical protein|nr:hypothetical protein [Bacteroidota bacterium]